MPIDLTQSTQQLSYDSYLRQIGDEIELSGKDRQRIKKKLKQEIQKWLDAMGPISKRLSEYMALAEGYTIYDSDPPYPGAFLSNIPIVQIFLSVIVSVQIRSILGADDIWYATSDPDYQGDPNDVISVESMLNFKARSEWNVIETLKEAIYCANRDGLSAIYIPMEWEDEVKKDVIYIHNAQDFEQDFPDAESVGMDEAEYNSFKAKTLSRATEEVPEEIPIEYTNIKYFGPKLYLVEYDNFVVFPANAKSIEYCDCRGYGYRDYLLKPEIKDKAQRKIWNKDATEAYLKKCGKAGTDVSDYQRTKDLMAGLSVDEEVGSHEFYFLTIWEQLEGEEKIKCYSLVYSYKHNVLVSFKEYVYRVCNMALFRVDKKPNQLSGRSVSERLTELTREINHLHEQRVQSRDITNIPTFKGKKSAQQDYDPNDELNYWRPGLILWLTDPDSFDQMKNQPTDNGETIVEEGGLMRYATMLIGADPNLFAGVPSEADPNAPGNKTGLLIQQSNLRMDDPINQLRSGVDQVGQICLSHMYQFGPAHINYFEGETQAVIRKRTFRSGIKVSMRAVGVTMNPDYEFQKGMQQHAALLQAEPTIAQDTKRRLIDLKYVLQRARYPNHKLLILSDQEIAQQAQAQAQQQQAIMQMTQQTQAVKQAKDAADIALKKSKIQSDAQKNAIAAHANIVSAQPQQQNPLGG